MDRANSAHLSRSHRATSGTEAAWSWAGPGRPMSVRHLNRFYSYRYPNAILLQSLHLTIACGPRLLALAHRSSMTIGAPLGKQNVFVLARPAVLASLCRSRQQANVRSVLT